MKRVAQRLLGISVLAGAVALGQSPSSPPSTQQPSGMPNSQQPDSRSNPSVDQMQRQTDNQMDNGAKQMMRSPDTSFAMKAAQGGMAEVKLGKLASEKASSPDVKAFGQQMVDDHTKANDQLKSVAKSENISLPGDVDGKSQRMYDKLSKLSGADFDKEYVKGMVKDHEEDIKDFQKEAKSGKNEKIKGFASETLPTLQSHLEKIKDIQSKMGSTGSTK